MKLHRTSDHLVSKYIHDDTSETAIKCVSSCDTIKNPVTGVLEHNPVDRNKYSIFVSSSAGCFMKCNFCYLTMKEMKYKKLKADDVLKNLCEAVVKEAKINPSIKDKYVKVCWMGMGDALADPGMVYSVTIRLIDFILENGFARGIDGVDVSTVYPKVNPRWMDGFRALNKLLQRFPQNPNNNVVVHCEERSNLPDVYIERSPFRLFYSLHSAIQETRDKLIPNAASIKEALWAIRHYSDYNRFNVIFHHMFIEGENDSDEELQALLNLITNWGLHQYEFRILRYNQCEANDIQESSRFSELVDRLAHHHNKLKVQISTGKEIQSACGQFITPQLKLMKETMYV